MFHYILTFKTTLKVFKIHILSDRRRSSIRSTATIK